MSKLNNIYVEYPKAYAANETVGIPNWEFPTKEKFKQEMFNETEDVFSVNSTKLEYCQNKECTKAAVASFFIGFPCFIIVSFCTITCLGFTCGGVAGGSAAAGCQSACYGGATGGCFSLCQSAGAGGFMGICFVIGLLSIIGGIFSTATWFLCLYTCEQLNGN